MERRTLEVERRREPREGKTPRIKPRPLDRPPCLGGLRLHLLGVAWNATRLDRIVSVSCSTWRAPNPRRTQ